jgi:hypothetical protein
MFFLEYELPYGMHFTAATSMGIKFATSALSSQDLPTFFKSMQCMYRIKEEWSLVTQLACKPDPNTLKPIL